MPRITPDAPEPRQVMHLKVRTRDRINLLKMRLRPVVGRSISQDQALQIVMDYWDAHANDQEAAKYAQHIGA